MEEWCWRGAPRGTSRAAAAGHYLVELAVERVEVFVVLTVHHVCEFMKHRLDDDAVVAKALKVVCARGTK